MEIEQATKSLLVRFCAVTILLLVSLDVAGAAPVQPKTDANDGLNGDNPYFQRHNVARAHHDTVSSFWYTSGYQLPDEPDPNGPQWVDYKPPLNILGSGFYRITAEYRAGSNRADYDALYIVHHQDGTTTIPKNQREGGGYVTFDLGEFDLGSTGWVRVQDTGDGSITFNKMKFTYLGPLVDNDPPSVPQDVHATATSAVSIRVSWSASTDNVGVAGYRIYRDGSQVGATAATSFVDTGLELNTPYSYTVSAYDSAGNESAQSSPPTVTIINADMDFCSVDMGSTDMINLLRRVAHTDGQTSVTLIDGLRCRQPFNSDNQYFYFAIDDGYIYDGCTSTVYLEVCYFDDYGFIEPQYDSTAGVYSLAERLDLKGSNQWKTAAWTLTGCKFANRQNNGADFRLYVGTNPVKIDTVRVSRIPYSHHGGVNRDIGVNEMYSGLSHPQYSDGNTAVTYLDGRYCRRSLTEGNNYFYFNVSDAVIYDGSWPTVYLKVDYYDSPAGSITPEYDSVTDPYSVAETLNFTGTNTWKEHIWILTDVKFANRQNASSDFRLYVGSGLDVHIDKVTVSKAPFGDTEPPSVPSNVIADAQSPSSVKTSWKASTDNVGVAGYRIYRDGLQVGTSGITEYVDDGLVPGTTYNYVISAYDLSGNESQPSSPPAQVVTPADMYVFQLKALPDLSLVGLTEKIITAIFSDYVYVGESDRSSGVRVVPLQMPAEITIGSIVDVVGTMWTVAGERSVTDAMITIRGPKE